MPLRNARTPARLVDVNAPDPPPILIGMTRSHDWTMLVLLSVFGSVSAFLAVGEDIPPSDVSGSSSHDIVSIYIAIVGPAGWRVTFAIVALVCLAKAFATAWRLREGGKMLFVDRAGISLHPSLHRGPLRWGAITRIAIEGNRSRQIVIRVKHRFWSLAAPLTSRRVSFGIGAARLSDREARQLVAQMRRWHRAALRTATGLPLPRARRGDAGSRR